MKIRKLLLWFVLVDFALFSTWVMWKVGYLGIWEAGFASAGSLQILCDLVISLSLVMVWLVQDARSRGMNPWPWLVATLAAGSLAPLLYLIVRERQPHSAQPGLRSAA